MKANLLYVRNYTSGEKAAEMYIYDEIGEQKVNGADFAFEMRYLLEVENVKNINVRINSPGGSVLHAFSIVSAIVNTNASGKATVNTYNDGVAASSAGFILLCGKNVYAKDYSRLMIHGVSGEAKNENDRSALKNFSEMITRVFSGRTGKVAAYFETLLNNGLDNWYSAEEAAKEGFIKPENIEQTGVFLDLPEDLNRTALAVANKAKQILNNVKTKPLAMKNVIAKLGLQEAASEEATLTAVSNVMKERDEAKTALTEVQNKNATLETANAELKTRLDAVNKASALNLVENAIKEGKFTPGNEEAKAALVAKAESDLEGFKNLVGMMPTKAANIMDGLKGGASASALEKVNNRSLRQLEKEDSGLVSEIRNNHRAEYVKMYNEAYKTQKTEAELYR